ncbi:hypothetical protein BU26DRAFT_522911 [Trematosphaeria pertusa]|uniref:Uncharacterized protein n=1 Tax=Trematosphaeria pertusa TaxID=390896 RepID=A0A6A6I2X0_9PLEO|nr:uncharacterized protein BU26DRAFT_522911 [Trematosphaeria pertusa]KAF2244223.1 hypothetical protein BU26DRAFT_522911 [Trematosphaeria pertusa]
MSAVHTCISSALRQAFRLPKHRVAASYSVPAFLVPAVARPPGRPFSSTKRRRKEKEHHQDTVALRYPPKPTNRFPPSHILFPDRQVRDDIQQWVAAIDPLLPPHLRLDTSNRPDNSSSVTAIDIARIINAAQDASQDILGHLGLVQQRWDTVVWVAKKLVQDGRPSAEASVHLEPFGNVEWPEIRPGSVDDLTNNPLRVQRAQPSTRLSYTLDVITSHPDSIDPQHRILKRALGQLWRSLGRMILVVADESHKEHDPIMPRVLEIIAYLHHIGLIPDSVYAPTPINDSHALQQPPTLHLLSSKILTALSDATWRAHEASVKVATERLNASYFLGHEIPGSRYKIQVTEVAPELWLELILWSCLHGGWIADGTAILEQVASHNSEQSWGLISWRELLQAKEQESADSGGWRLFQRRQDVFAKAEDRARTRRTISSEIVTSFIDGLVNNMRLGVGARGADPEHLVERIKKLKHFLDLNSLSLGSATWDSIMARLLESGGIAPEKRPELLLSILDLASGFGAEVGAINVSSQTAKPESEPPYFFEPTTIPLSLLHRTMRAFVENGDIAGAMTTLKTLQQYTDSNKQRSLEHFFETLKTVPLWQDEPFTSALPPIEFPAFDNQLPIPLLAKLLDLATDAKMYELGRWFLFSKDLDGPLIHPYMYADWNVAASIIRFATLAGENDLVLKIVEQTGSWSKEHQAQRMPHELLTALLCSQIKLHRWQSVRGMQEHVLETPGYRPRPEILAKFAAELLRSEGDSSMKTQARNAFTKFLFTWEDLILSHARNELYCVLGILSTVHEEWKEYCSQFLSFSTRQGIRLSTDDFNQILGGVLDGYGSLQGRKVVDAWCYKPPKPFEPYRAPGGLPTMPRTRVGKGEEYESRPGNIEIVQSSGAGIIFQGRIYPNRQTIWAILRKVQQEEDHRRAKGEELTASKRAKVRETLEWAAKLLYYLGFDYEDIVRDLGGLAELAELEAPSAPRVVRFAGGEPGF